MSVAAAARPIVVIGGGLAGIAASVRLALAGRPVLLLEQRARLGGRAYSLRDAASGDVIDNGQHVLTGACTASLSLFRTLGTDDALTRQRDLRIEFIDTGGASSTLRCPPLPAPLHLLAGLLRLRALPLGDRLAALRVGWALRRLGAAGDLDALTVEAWLDRLRQPEAARRHLWRPLAEAIVNETADRASALPLARTLAESFLGGRAHSGILMAAAGLSRLYEAAAPPFLEARGGRVETGARATAIVTEGNGGADRVTGVRTSDGALREASGVIAAVPHQVLPALLPERWRAAAPFAALPALGSAPIVSVHLWLDRRVTSLPFAGLLGTEAQWVFNREAIASDVSGHLLTLVHSAAHRQAERTAADLALAGMEELRRAIPEARAARLLRFRVIKERRATFSARPGTDRLRPGPVTPLHGLWLAGDWTATGLPATIESAVRSGNAAGDAVLLGREP